MKITKNYIGILFGILALLAGIPVAGQNSGFIAFPVDSCF